MARPRFPGRPGCRYERISVRYLEEESRTQTDPNFGLVLSFCCGLKQFRELVGESDEDEEFEGFTQQEVRASARKYVAMQSSSKNEQDSPESSSSSSSSSLSSVAGHRISGTSRTRRQKVRATMASAPYIKKGLGKKSRAHFHTGRTVQNVYTAPKVATTKLKNIKIELDADGNPTKIVRKRGRPALYLHTIKKQSSVRPPASETLMNERSSQNNAVLPSCSTFGRGRKLSVVAQPRSKRLGKELAKHLLLKARKGHDPFSSSTASSKDHILDSGSTPGYQRKRFILPTKSSRSSRVIKPNKKFLEDDGYQIMFSKSQIGSASLFDKEIDEEKFTDANPQPSMGFNKEFSKVKRQQKEFLEPLSPPPKSKRGRKPLLKNSSPPLMASTSVDGSVKACKKNMQGSKYVDLHLETVQTKEDLKKSRRKCSLPVRSLPVSGSLAESKLKQKAGLTVEPSPSSSGTGASESPVSLKPGRKNSSLDSPCVGTSPLLQSASTSDSLRKTRQRGDGLRSGNSPSLETPLFQLATIPEATDLRSGGKSLNIVNHTMSTSPANPVAEQVNTSCLSAASLIHPPVSGQHYSLHDESGKVGLFDQPLIVEGKRQRKPSLRMRLKQSEELFNYKELKRSEMRRLMEEEDEKRKIEEIDDTLDENADLLETEKASNLSDFEVEDKPSLASIDQSLPTLPTSPFRPNLELFTPCGSGGSFISPTEKQKLEELDRETADATRRSGNSILRKAKFQLNRAALNRSKAALARSLKAKMRHEAKLEKKKQREQERKLKQTAVMMSPLALSSLSVVARGLTDVHGSPKRSLIKTEGGVTSPAVSPGSTVVTPVATTVTPGNTLTLSQSQQNDGDSSLQPTAESALKRSRKMCAVCGDKIGVVSFFGVPCCTGCRKFYMLSMKRKKIPYHCKKAGCCAITRVTKSQCNACRLRRCQELFSTDSDSLLSAASSVSTSSRSAYQLSLTTTTKKLTKANKKAEETATLLQVSATSSMETARVAATAAGLTSPKGKTPGSNRKGRRSRDTSDEDPPKEESFRGDFGSGTSNPAGMTSVGRRSSSATSKSLPRKSGNVLKLRRRRKVRCKQCEGCLADDCGVCVYCLDKPKYGGKNVIKQACINRRCTFPSYTKCATNSFILPKKSENPDDDEPDSYTGTPNSHRDRRRRTGAGQLDGRPSSGHQPKLGKPNVKLKRPYLFQQLKKRNKEKAVTLCGKSTDSVNMLVQAPNSYWGAAAAATAGCLSSKGSGPLAVRKWTNQDYMYSPAAHRIRVDYKEDCDLCRVWEQGLAILVSTPLCMRTVCYLCGSAGQHDFVYCHLCCEPFHLFCLDEDSRPTEKNQESWCCLRCQYCQVCGKQDNLLQCNKCQDTYHPECLGPNYPTKPSKKKKIWICTKCVRCKSCGATTPGNSGNATWMHDFSLCYECGKLMDRGNFCPICRKCYTDDDWDSKMVQCSTCESWVHATCGGLTDELYQMFSHLPEDVPYICLLCSEKTPASWECVIRDTRQHGFSCVMKALQNSKCAQHLMGPNAIKLLEKKKTSMKTCKPSNLSKDCHDSPPDASQEVVFAVSTPSAGTIPSPTTQTTSPASSICHNNPPAFNSSLKDTASSSPEKGLTIPKSSVAAIMTASTTITTSCTTAATCLKAHKSRTSDCDKLTECGQVATFSAKLEAKTYTRTPHVCDNSQSQYSENLQNSVWSYSKPRKCLLDGFKRTLPSAPVPALVSSAHSASPLQTPTTIPSTFSPQTSINSTITSVSSSYTQTHSTSSVVTLSSRITLPSPTLKSVPSSSSTSPLANTSPLPLSPALVPSSSPVPSSPATIPQVPHSLSSSPVTPKSTPFLIPPPLSKSAVSTAAQTTTSSIKSVSDSLSSKTTAASPNKTGGACRFVMGPMPPSEFFRRNKSSRSLGISIISSTASSSSSNTITTTTTTTTTTTSNNQTTTIVTAATSTTSTSSSSSCTNTSLCNISRTTCSPGTSSTICTSMAISSRSAAKPHTNVSSSQTMGNLTSPNTIPTLGGKPTSSNISNNNLAKWSSPIAKGNHQGSLPSSGPSGSCLSSVANQSPPTAGIKSSSSNSPITSCAANANKEAFPGRGICNLYKDRLSTFHSPKPAPFTPPPTPSPASTSPNAASPLMCNASPYKKPSDHLKANILANSSVNRTFKTELKGHPLKGSYEVSKLNTIIEEDEEKEVISSSCSQVTCENSFGKCTSKAVTLPMCKSESNDTAKSPSVKVSMSASNTARRPPSRKASASSTAYDEDINDGDGSATDTAPEDSVEVEVEKPKFSEVRANLRKERLKLFAQARRNRSLIDYGNGTIMCPALKKGMKKVRHIKHPKYFESVVYKVNNYLYHSVQQFTEDMVRIIQTAVNDPKGQTVSRKRANNSVRSIFIKQMEKYFPWFNLKACALWDHNRNLPAGMLPNGVLPPSSDHNYAQWMKEVSQPISSKAAPLRKLSRTPVKSSSKAVVSLNSENNETNKENNPTETVEQFCEDTRTCVLCWKATDLQPEEEGRLIYVGQDDWVHVNCALWSAEAFEDEMDGTLQNVQSAVSRGKMMRCDKCSRSGATVGCCHRGCPANFHFLCAKQESCVFQEDKKVYCYNHRHKVDGNLVEDNDFDVIRRVCIFMDPQKYPKKSWVKGLLAPSINIVIGSCTIENLGSLTPLSDTWDMLLPVGFRSTRVYWSTKHVNRYCVYTCRIIAVKPQCQKESTNLASSKQMAIEHNTTKIEDPVLANATMAPTSTSSTGTTNSNASNSFVASASDSDKSESSIQVATPTETQSDAVVNDNGNKESTASSDLVQQISNSEKTNDQSVVKSTSEEIKKTQSLAGSGELSSANKKDSSQKSEANIMTGDCLRERNDVSVLDITEPLSPSTQTALETLHDTSKLFAGEDEKKWLENLPEDMETIVVVAQGEDITDDEAIQLATEALQVAGNTDDDETSEAQSSCQEIPSEGTEEEASRAKLEVEEVISTEKYPPVIEMNCMTMGKKTLPDNFHETSLYDVTEAQVLTEGNKEVMYLGVENKPVEVISLNQRTLTMNMKSKNKCSRLTSRTRESRSSRYSPIYGADGKIIGHKLSISDALSLKTSPKNIKNNCHRNVENKRAKRMGSKNNPMRYQSSMRSPNSSPGKSASIDNNERLADIESKGQRSQLNEVKCKVMNGEKWEEVMDSSLVGCCDLSAKENLQTEIKQENNADSALLADKTWSDNSFESVKNQERNKNSAPVKVYPLRQTVSRMCEQALAKRPLEAISRSCRDDRTKSLLASHSTEPHTVMTTCGDSVSIKKSVDDTIPLHDKIALKIKAESLAKSSPGERGPFKCPICKRLYRTKESFETHVEKCDFELSTSEEEDEEQDSLRSPRRYLGNPRYPMRSTTLIQRVAAEVEAEMNLIKKFIPRKRSHDSVSSSDIGTDTLDTAKSKNKQMRQDKPYSADGTTITGCDRPNQLPQSEPLLGCDNNNDASNKSIRCDSSSCAMDVPMLSSDIPNTEKLCKLETLTNNNCSSSNDARQQEEKTSNNDNNDDADFDSDATLSPVPYDNYLDQNYQSDEESNNSMLCPKTGFTIPAGTNRNNLDLLSELATKLSKPDTSNSEKGGHLIGLKSTEPKLPSDIALAKKMSVVEVPGGLYKQKFEVINGKIGKVCSTKRSASVGGDLGVLPNHIDGSNEPLTRHCNSLDKPNQPISKGDFNSSKLPEGASTHSPSENQNKSGHQSLFERIFHSIDASNVLSKSMLNVLEFPPVISSNISTVSPLRNIDSESNSKPNLAPKENAGRETSQKCTQKINNCFVAKSVSGVNQDPKQPVIHTSSVPQSSPSLTSSLSPSLSQSSSSLGIMNSHHAPEAGSYNQAVPVKSVEAKPSQQPLFVRPSTMASQVLTTPVVSMALCNTVCSLTSQTTCMVAPTQQLGVPMQSASPHVLGLTTPNGPIFQSPALPPMAAPTAFASAAVTPITLAQPTKCQPQPTLNINYVGSFVLPTPADQLVTISRSIASIPLSSIATSVPHLQAASSLGSVVTTAKLQSPTVAVPPPQQNSVLLPDGSIQTIHKAPVPTMQTPNSIVKILVDNSSTQFVASANIDTSPQPQGSIYNYGKLLQEIFKANQTPPPPPALTTPTANPAAFSTPAVNSNPLINETKLPSPVKCTTTTSSCSSIPNSDPGGPSSAVSSCVPMRKMTSHATYSKQNIKSPGILRQQNQEDSKQLINSYEVSQILSGVQEGNDFVKSVVDLTSRQDPQITNGKTYMPPVKKNRPNLLRKQQSDVGLQPTKQIMSYLSNKNGLTTDYQKNSCSLEVNPQKVTNPLEINQKSNQTVLVNKANQMSTTTSPLQEPHRNVNHDVKAVCKPTIPRSRRKAKPIVRHSRLEMKGTGPESGCPYNECPPPSQMLEDEDEEEEMPFMSQQSKNFVPPTPTPKPDPTTPHLIFEISSEDGFYCRAYSMEDAWQQVFDGVQELRAMAKIKQLPFANVNGALMFGVSHHSVIYLLEQLHGARNCNNYRFNYHSHQREKDYDDQEPAVNPSGCIRTEPFSTRKPYDMFSFLMSRYRNRPQSNQATGDEEMALKSSRRPTSMDLPMAMRFRHLQAHAREAVGVYRSLIHGRGLFCKRNIDAGEMVIEYAGEVIRAELTDKREKFYESKGIGCYMFRIDDIEVVDATMHGNAARFINHSCDPNCYSKVIQVDGKKHIVIFAMRPIKRGEELTYDYKFPIEEIKIPCTCGSRRCRKYLN